MTMNGLTLPKKAREAMKRPLFIEGLPGLGNVGRIAVDLLIDQLKAKRLLRFAVDEEPGLVLVRENNLVSFPELSLYHARHKGRDLLLLTGDSQPGDEATAYRLGERLLAMLEEAGCEEIVTIGGIGLQQVPETPIVYVTGSDKALVAAFKKHGAENRIHGVVGPIIGLTGLLLGVAKGRIPAVALLAESVAHPMYLGFKGAEQVLSLLSKRYGFKLDLSVLAESIDAMDSALHGQAPAGELPKRAPETNYIG